jgi:hypothetical protein
VTAHERRIYRGDDDIGGVDYDSCVACQYVRLGEIGLLEVEQRRGIGTCVLAQLRAELPGYHWAITPGKRSSRSFWNHMRTTTPASISREIHGFFSAHIALANKCKRLARLSISPLLSRYPRLARSFCAVPAGRR